MSSSTTHASTGTRDQKRFTTGDHADVEDVADPHTIEDDTHEPLRKRLWKYRWFLVLGVPIAFAAIAILLGYMWHMIPEIASNRYVQLGVAFLSTIGLTAYFADNRRQNLFMNYQWLVLRTKEGPQRYLGHLKQGVDGAPLFTPVKGFRHFGLTAEPYTIEEFGHELGETWANANRDADDAAVIRLHPAFVSIAKTDLGTVIEQSTTKVQVDPFARGSTLHAPEPELIEDDIAENLRDEIVQMREEREDLNDRLDKVQRRLEAAKDVGAMTPEEFLESHEEFALRMMAVARGRSSNGSKQNGTSGSLAPSTETDPELQQVEAELMQDD
ncbi:hypothetical protein [Halomontanus rarus]|uniref:hypothetical protein n=1 Tax=Halomontanus rarus TaxID=3034020 RepID=UPI00307C3564